MAGTYTPNLVLYKPAVGELSWGAAMNHNLDLIDTAMLSIGAVSSVHGRLGAVVAASGDYTWAQITKTPGTDYYAPSYTDVAIADGGTGQSTAQLGIDALTQVSGATNEYVLTKDTATGHAIFKVASGGGITDIVNDTTPQLGGQLDNNGFPIGDGTLEILKFGETASAVNEVTITNAATAGSPSIAATGDDTNINLTIQGKGSGVVVIGGTTAQIKDANSNELFKFTATGSAVNEITVANAATGSGPTMTTTGGDTNAPITLAGKGTGAVILGQATSTDVRLLADQPLADSSGNEFIKFTKTASAVNEITVKNNSTGVNPRISATGETNVALELSGKGARGIAAVNAMWKAEVTLTPGATPALDASLGNTFYVAATGNYIIAVPSNAPASGYSQEITIVHYASGGARTLGLNTGAGGFRFGADITALTQTTSGKKDYIGCKWCQTDSFWDVVAYAKGF